MNNKGEGGGGQTIKYIQIGAPDIYDRIPSPPTQQRESPPLVSLHHPAPYIPAAVGTFTRKHLSTK